MNVLVYAHREDTEHPSPCLRWLEATISGDERYGVAEVALCGFICVVTHPKLFTAPGTLRQALEFAEEIREQPSTLLNEAGERHRPVFRRLGVDAKAKGSLVPDAHFAALANEGGCERITTDRDDSRFPGLRWRSPL